MAEPSGKSEGVLVGRESRQVRPSVPRPSEAWKWIGWFGLVLAAAGLTDLLLLFVPPNFGNAEWEFGTVVQLVSALPLVTMGLAALFGAGMALGKRWLQLTVGIGLLLGTLVLTLLLVMFLSHVPMALGVVQEPALTGVKKAIVKTMALGLYFGVGYGVGAFVALRSSLGRSWEGSVAT